MDVTLRASDRLVCAGRGAGGGHVFAALSGGDLVALLDAAGTMLSTTHLGGLGFPQGLAYDLESDGWIDARSISSQ